MPCKSKKQCSYMGAIAGGTIKKKGLSKSKAKEMVRGASVHEFAVVRLLGAVRQGLIYD